MGWEFMQAGNGRKRVFRVVDPLDHEVTVFGRALEIPHDLENVLVDRDRTAQVEHHVRAGRDLAELPQNRPAAQERDVFREPNSHPMPRAGRILRIDVKEVRVEITVMEDHDYCDGKSEDDAG